MKIDKEAAMALKMAVKSLHDTQHGLLLLDFLDEIAGKYAPNYDGTNTTSVLIAAGRTEVMQTIRNLDRLTTEQIVHIYQGEE